MTYTTEDLHREAGWQGMKGNTEVEAMLRAGADAIEREKIWQRNSRETWNAMQAMRNAINEHTPIPSIESDLLEGPENSVFCERVATAVIDGLRQARHQALEEAAEVEDK